MEGRVGSHEPVWRAIRRLRHSNGYSQYTLARKLVEVSGNTGITREEVARWERGKRIPGPYWRDWLSSVLGVRRDVLDAAAEYARKVRRVRKGWVARLVFLCQANQLNGVNVAVKCRSVAACSVIRYPGISFFLATTSAATSAT